MYNPSVECFFFIYLGHIVGEMKRATYPAIAALLILHISTTKLIQRNFLKFMLNIIMPEHNKQKKNLFRQRWFSIIFFFQSMCVPFIQENVGITHTQSWNFFYASCTVPGLLSLILA